MHVSIYRVFPLALLTLPLLLASCSSEQEPVAEQPPTAVEAPTNDVLDATASVGSVQTEGVPGGVVTSEVEVRATVIAIDAEARHFVLQDGSGNQRKIQAPPEMVNFSQLAVGDKVLAKIVVETVSYLKPVGEASGESGGATVVAAPEVGQKPGMVVADQAELTALVESIDFDRRVATLRFPDGSTEIIGVRSDVELSEDQIGREVVIRTTMALAISVVKE